MKIKYYALLLFGMSLLNLLRAPSPDVVFLTSYHSSPIVFRDGLENWDSINELKMFIWQDDRDLIEYSENFTCMDFTIRLIQNAENQGKRLYFVYQKYDNGSGHALVMAYVEKEGCYVCIEPQKDDIQWKWTRIEVNPLPDG